MRYQVHNSSDKLSILTNAKGTADGAIGVVDGGVSAPIVIFAVVIFAVVIFAVVFGIPHNFDSVVFTKLSFGLLGSHTAATCSGVNVTFPIVTFPLVRFP